jgi:hypothetical protein
MEALCLGRRVAASGGAPCRYSTVQAHWRPTAAEKRRRFSLQHRLVTINEEPHRRDRAGSSKYDRDQLLGTSLVAHSRSTVLGASRPGPPGHSARPPRLDHLYDRALTAGRLKRREAVGYRRVPTWSISSRLLGCDPLFRAMRSSSARARMTAGQRRSSGRPGGWEGSATAPARGLAREGITWHRSYRKRPGCSYTSALRQDRAASVLGVGFVCSVSCEHGAQ